MVCEEPWARAVVGSGGGGNRLPKHGLRDGDHEREPTQRGEDVLGRREQLARTRADEEAEK
jgi:hypothetical protein